MQKLAALEQDMTDTKSLDPIRKPLIQQTLLHHKESVLSWMDDNIRDWAC